MSDNMKTTKEIFDELKKPFKPEDLEWRIGKKSKDKTKATVFTYIDARAIQERLDSTVGPDKWTVEYIPVDLGSVEENGAQKAVKGFLASLTLEMPDGTVIKRTDGSNCTDFEPFKGGISGALKRVASTFGIGRYLYKLPKTWVPIDQWGNFTPPRLPQWALPEDYEYPETENTTSQNFVAQQNRMPSESQNIQSTPQSQGNGEETVFTAGKYRGKPVSSVTDFGYLTWVVNKSNMAEGIKNAASRVLADLQMEAYEGEPA